MLREGLFLGDAAVEALAVGVEGAAAVSLGPVHRPAPVSGDIAGRGALRRLAGVAGGPVSGRGVGVEVVVAGVEVSFGAAAGNLVGEGVAEGRLSGRRRVAVGLGVPLVAGQQGIALDLGLDIGLEFEVGQLQQLDGPAAAVA